MRYILGRAATREETEAEWERRLTRQSDAARGLGYWVGFADGEFAGWWSASSFTDQPWVSGVGYRLAHPAWGRGLATEGTRAMVSHAFSVPGIDQVVASTMAVNERSRRVLEKSGLRHTSSWVDIKDDPIPGWEQGEVGYAIDRDEWQQRVAWDAEAATYDEAADHGLRDPTCRAAWRDLLLAAMPPAPARVADLGCGTGTLSLLLTESGHDVDGVDHSPEMLRLAEAKVGDRVRFALGDAADPGLAEASYDVVLCRHVLWALPDPTTALDRWIRLLRPGGRLVLVEGSWSTGAGLTAERTRELVEATGRNAEVTALTDPVLWGREIEDERYLVVS